MSKKKAARQIKAVAAPPVRILDVAALERERRDTQIGKQRDARARSRERRIDRLFTISGEYRVQFSKLHERPRGEDKVAYPLSSRFAAHLDHVRDRKDREEARRSRVLGVEPSPLLAARVALRARYPKESQAFELTTFGGLSQSALARQLGTTPGCIGKRISRALYTLEELLDTPADTPADMPADAPPEHAP